MSYNEHPSTHTLAFDGDITRRGFWLYVWRIKYGGDKEVLYVGRTGDSSSLNAGAPYACMGRHLDPKSRGNSIYTKLQEHKINPQCCKFEMIAHGPLLFEPPHKHTPNDKDKEEFRNMRDIMAALEQGLTEALRRGEYCVLNTVRNLKPLCWQCWVRVHQAFQKHFDQIALAPRPTTEKDHSCTYHRGN